MKMRQYIDAFEKYRKCDSTKEMDVDLVLIPLGRWFFHRLLFSLLYLLIQFLFIDYINESSEKQKNQDTAVNVINTAAQIILS